MNNKLFAALIVLILLPFFGWMYEDWKNDSQAAQKDGANRDLLMDEKGDAAAEIEYIFHFPDPVYSHSLTTSQIEALSQSGGEAEHYHVYGLTQAGYSINSLYEVNWSKKWFRPEYSIWVEDLRVEFTYNTLNVFVTSTYPEGSCEYQATLDHENQHVAIHREMYEQYQQIFRQKVGEAKDIPLASSPIVASSIEEGKTRISQLISAALDPPFEQFKEALQTEQDKLDTPDSYAELKGRCQNW
jgi:hypothetical protein